MFYRVSNGGSPEVEWVSTTPRYVKPTTTTSETFTATESCIYCMHLNCGYSESYTNTFTVSSTGQIINLTGNNSNNVRVGVILEPDQSLTYVFHINYSINGTLEYWKITF